MYILRHIGKNPMKKSTVAKNIYGFEISSQVISNLTNWAQFGKNANIILNLAKLINSGDDLPQWFLTCFNLNMLKSYSAYQRLE